VALLSLVLGQLGLLALVAATAWAAGRRLLARRWPDLLAHPITLAVGFAALTQLSWLFAVAGWLRTPILPIAVIALHVLVWRDWRSLLARIASEVRRQPARAAGIGAAVALLVVPGFLVGLYPPTAFDETTYHLPFVRALAAGGLPWLPDLRFPIFPLLAESLAAPLLIAGGAVATHLVALFATMATAPLLVAWGREARDTVAGWLAAGIFAGSPLVAYLAGTGYVEPPLALLATGAFYAAWRGRSESGTGWAMLAGAVAGSAAAVKYLGLYAVLVVAVFLAAAGRAGLRRAAVAVAAALVALAPTYVPIVLLTGNPTFPLFAGLFGHSAWDPVGYPGGAGAHAVAVLRLAWDGAFHHREAGGLPPLSPLFVLTLPLVLGFAARRRAAIWAIAAIGGFLVALMPAFADARYLAAILPLWSLLIGLASGWAWSRWQGRAPRAAVVATVALALAAPGILYGPFFAQRAGHVPADPTTYDAFLRSHVPGYASLDAFERRVGPSYTLYCMSCEHLHGLARGRLLGEWAGPWRYQLVARFLHDPAALRSRLRAMDAGYVMLPRAEGESLAAAPRAAELLPRIYADATHQAFAVAPALRSPPASRARRPGSAAD
jgi:hypothetical protein